MKNLFGFLTAVAACLYLPVAVAAKEVPDFSRTGSVTVSLEYEGEAVTDGSLVFYRVGDILEEDGDYSFALSEIFEKSGADLKKLSDPSLAEFLASYASENSLTGITAVCDSNGQLRIDDVKIGLYLVIQDSPSDGFEPMEPFLISVPQYEDGRYLYDVNAEPKMAALIPVSPDELPGTGSTLLQTGPVTWPLPILTTSGLGLLLVGFYIRNGTKSDEA